MQIVKILYLLTLLCSILSCEKPPSEDAAGSTEGAKVRLAVIEEFLYTDTVTDSHKGDELRSVLQPVYKYSGEIPSEKLTVGAPEGDQQEAFYPRVKRLSDGSFILFYMGGQYGSRIWCVKSDDFIAWSEPVMLFEPERVTIVDPSGQTVQDWRRFVNMDAVVLPDGKIVAVCSYRASGHYGYGIDCGLMSIVSTDNGKTWSAPRKIYEGPNWEPYILRLPDGRLQCFFTDAVPQTRNSGTSVIVSDDDGETWSGKTTACRQYKYDYRTSADSLLQYNGQKIYTDQMPCFRVLNDGKTIFGFLEARLETPPPADCGTDTYKSHYKMSLVWNDGLDWETPSGDEDLPLRRETNAFTGAGGYVETFPSGEVVISAAIGGIFKMKLGNSTATEWQGGMSQDEGWLQGLPEGGFWGSMEKNGPNALLVSMKGPSGIQTGMFFLNNRVDVHKAEVVSGGDDKEWEDVKDGFYISSDVSRKGVFLRFANTADTLFVRADREDLTVGTKNRLDISFADEAGTAVDVSLLPSGIVSAPEGVKSVCRQARSELNGKGFVYEVAIPMSLLGAPGAGDRLNFYADMQEDGISNTFTFSEKDSPSTWQLLEFVDD